MKQKFLVSTWSLHRQIGFSFPDAPSSAGKGQKEDTWGIGSLSLFDLPAMVRKKGFEGLQICHFHLNSTDREWLADVRSSIESSGMYLEALLVDDGDINDPFDGQRDQDWIRNWIDIGAQLGAKSVRVIAGKQAPSPEALSRSERALSELVVHARSVGTSLSTENWFETTRGSEEVNQILDGVRNLQFLVDLGNWSGRSKYQELGAIGGRAEFCHAKCEFGPELDMKSEDFEDSLMAIWNAGYASTLALIYDGPSPDEWGGLEMEREFIESLWQPATG